MQRNMYREAIILTIGFIISFFLMILTLISLSILSVMDTYDPAPLRVAAVAVTTTQSLDGRVIILDPGHGEGNTNTFEGYDEHVRMLALAHKIKPLLEAKGATVLMTRATEEDVLLPVRAAMINKWGLEAVRDLRLQEMEFALSEQGAFRIQRDIAEIDRLLNMLQSIIDDPETNAQVYMNFPFDTTYTRRIHPYLRRVFEHQNAPEIREQFLVISLHSNATPRPIDTTRHGADSFFVSNTIRNNANYFQGYTSVDQSAYFAEKIIRNIEPLGIAKNKASANLFFILREHNLPGVLVENGFHTNPQDRAKLQDDDFLNRLAVVYADTILDYFANIDSIPEYRPFAPRIFYDVFGIRLDAD